MGCRGSECSVMECGVQGLTDRSRRPYRYANRLPVQVENDVLNVKREHPSWGACKIRGSAWRGDSQTSRSPPKAPSMQCWTVMAWWSGAVARGGMHRAPLYRSGSVPMNCGARITRRVPARQSSLLLSTDRHRSCQPLSAELRGAVLDPRRLRLYGL